jgi:hypothetical protein
MDDIPLGIHLKIPVLHRYISFYIFPQNIVCDFTLDEREYSLAKTDTITVFIINFKLMGVCQFLRLLFEKHMVILLEMINRVEVKDSAILLDFFLGVCFSANAFICS